uniref:Uncharacterized protein n=1 Tax=Glossina morsitans morsitans TaxID=37546 RepID=A0A1B0FQ25_GLOMM
MSIVGLLWPLKGLPNKGPLPGPIGPIAFGGFCQGLWGPFCNGICCCGACPPELPKGLKKGLKGLFVFAGITGGTGPANISTGLPNPPVPDKALSPCLGEPFGSGHGILVKSLTASGLPVKSSNGITGTS